MEPRSIYEVFQQVVRTNAAKIAYRLKKDGRWGDLTWAEHGKSVLAISKSLVALGVERCERVAILSQTRLEWVQCDFAIANCGAAAVGIYPSLLARDCAFILDHSDSVVLFVEDRAQLDKVLSLRAELPKLRHVVLFEGPVQGDPNVWDWEAFLRLGQDVPDGEMARRGAEIEAGDLAMIVYTSGTTGMPKGVMITHRNILFSTWSAGQCLYLEPHFVTLLFLPLAHVFGRLIVHCFLRSANTVAFAESLAKIPENLAEIRPHFIASVPRIYEKMYEKVTARRQQSGALVRRLFDWAVAVGRRVSRLRLAGQLVPLRLRLLNALATALVFRKIQAALGGRLVYAVSGSAPLDPEIAEFFHACGITILEGYGMTENTSFSNVNLLDRNKFGTVGPAGPGIEMKIASDGEILVRGENVMSGYFKNPGETAEAIDSEGWLQTGDIGEIDGQGFLKITDRKKDLIVTAGGKNVAPQHLERVLRSSAYIGQVVAYGDRRKYITALVTLDPDNVRRFAADHGLDANLEQLAVHPAVVDLMRREIEVCNRQLASFESVKKFRIVPRPFSVEDGDLTPTLKIRRKAVVEKYRALLDDMYAA